jgi:hypothetical protein
MKTILTLTILTLILFSCNSNESINCGDPVPEVCSLIMVDKSDNFLVGQIYTEDSITLFVAGQSIPLNFENGRIYFNYHSLKSYNQEDYILKLSANETDTLNLILRTYTNECFTSQILDTLKYNKQVIGAVTGGSYKIIK